MRKTLKKYFIPHEENNFHPHILHTKRAVFYGLVFLLAKVVLVTFVIFLPTEVFVLPDVLAEEQKQIIVLTNEVRAENGLPTLVVATKLNTSAQYKADDMSAKEYFAHSENNTTVSTWLQSAGYQYETAGENLAVGYSTAQDIVDAWKKSPGHYANLVDTDFKDLGVGLSGGIYNGQATVFIAQHLASPLAFVEAAKESVKVVVKSKVEKKVEVKPKTIEVTTTNEIAIANNTSTTSSSSVLSAKVENIVPTAAPVMNLKAPTPIDKYIQAKSVLSPLTNIFQVSQNIYLGAMCFFAFVLFLNICVEIRRQHPHVIFQTSGLIALLFIFWKF